MKSSTGAAAWTRFLDRTLLALGTLLSLSAVIYFCAYNWQALPRFAKFGLLEGLILTGFLLSLRLPGMGSQWALTAAATLVGPLLGIYGQTYQTGGDSYGIFLTWAAITLPWVVTARFGPLWVGWLFLTNTAIWLVLDQRHWTGSGDLGFQNSALLVAGYNAVVWLAWESWRARLDWVREASLPIVPALLSLGWTTLVVCWSILDSSPGLGWACILVLWGGLFGYYGRRPFGLPFLAAAWASAMTVVSLGAARLLLSDFEKDWFFGPIFLSIFVLLELGVAASWLRRAQRRLQPPAPPEPEKVPVPEGPPVADGSPWYVRLVLGCGAWLAGLLLILVLGLFGMIGGDVAAGVTGSILVGLGAMLLRARRTSEFFAQMSLSCLLGGQVLVLGSLWSLLGHTSLAYPAAACLFLAICVRAYPDRTGRFFSGLATGFVICQPFTGDAALPPDLLVLLTALAAGWLTLGRPDPSLGTAAVVTLFGVLTGFYWDWFASRVQVGAASSLLLTLASTWLVARVVRRLELPMGPGLLALGSILLAGAVTWRMPGVVAGMGVLVLGFETGNLLLQGLAWAFLLNFGSIFYYELNLTLFAKSLSLLGAGAYFFAVRLPLARPARLQGSPPRYSSFWLGLGLLLTLGVPNLMILNKERLQGRVVYLELAPVDPRSLMQGDYMRLNYKLNGTLQSPPGPSGRLVAQLDSRGVASFSDWDRGQTLAASQLRLRYATGPRGLSVGTDAFYFQEGQRERYAGARYGKFTVNPSGEMLLQGLADEQLRDL